MINNIKYWVGAVGFLIIFIFVGVIIYSTVFFGKLPLSIDKISFSFLCAIWLTKYLLDTQMGVYSQVLGAKLANFGALKASRVTYQLGKNLPSVLLSFIPASIFILGLIFQQSPIGAFIFSYGNSILSLVLGSITIRYYYLEDNHLGSIISSIGFVATIVIMVFPPFHLSEILNSSIITSQLFYCGLVTSSKYA